jgi:carbonic anhydrase
VLEATRQGTVTDVSEVGRLHLRNTVRGLVEASELISDAIAEGRLAVVGANYRLSEGRAAPDVVIGSV